LITSNSNLGFGKAANRGIVQAKGEYIVVMNSDVIIPEPQNITVMLEYLERNPDVGLVGPKLLNFDNSHQPSAFRYYTPLSIVLRRTPLGKTSWGKEKIDKFMMRDYENLTETPTEVDWLMGSIMATKKSYIEKIGLFDERFFMYMEDVDLCRRYWENDLKVIYYPLAAVYHFHGRASRTKNIFFALLNKYTRTHLMSAIKYFKKHGLKTPRYGK
ncbi:MAG: glycosyltransferase family 2 protein, partial [Candidatus Spechtbacterales bacterium]|nr:glycosyltransferase family 2 protein [Candidatus Spechtbacterales bacterium]